MINQTPRLTVLQSARRLPSPIGRNGQKLEGFVAWAMELYRRGWHPIPIGREVGGKPPGKIPWFKGQIGFNGVDAHPYEFQWWPQRIHSMIARGIVRRAQPGHAVPGRCAGDRRGCLRRQTRVANPAPPWRQKRGPLPPTYRVTSRPYESGSGIRLFGCPVAGMDQIGSTAISNFWTAFTG